jgi:hypothetical protein
MQPDEVRVFRVNAGDFQAAQLRFRDLLDIADAAGIDVMDMSAIASGKKGTGSDRIRTIAAFTWVMERKNEPDLTFDDVLDGRVEVVGKPTANPTREILTQS